MPEEPADLFIGVVDLFAILLPGAVLAALLGNVGYERLIGDLLPTLTTDAAKWLAFAIASYFLGHFLVLIGAAFDPLYDRVRQWKIPLARSGSCIRCSQ